MPESFREICQTLRSRRMTVLFFFFFLSVQLLSPLLKPYTHLLQMSQLNGSWRIMETFFSLQLAILAGQILTLYSLLMLQKFN